MWASAVWYLAFVQLLFSCTVAAWPWQSKEPPVCIVGAGPAGLSAAQALESKGHDTVIFEKQPLIGGKCQSVYEDGTFFPLGAAFFSNESWPETVKVINDSGVLSQPFFLRGTRQEFEFEYETGVTFPLPQFPASFIAALTEEVPRYIGIWNTLFEPIVRPGYKSGVPEALAVPALQWLTENNFTALAVLIVDPVALYGYGDISIVPILYIMQYMSPDVVLAFAGLHSVYFVDFHAVWEQWAAKYIKGTINTSTNITGIDRSGKYIKLSYANQGEKGPSHDSGWGWIAPWGYKDKDCWQPCSSLVLAFPPTLENLQAAGLDLTEDEHTVFGPVGVHNYYSSAVEFEGLPFGVSYIGASNISAAQPPPNDGQPVAALRLHENSNIVTWWSWGPYRVYQDISTAYDLLKTTLSRINKDPRNATAASAPVTDEDIYAFRKWDYFPHYDSQQLAQGYFAKFNALQGQKKTYYASGFNGFENVEWALRAGRDVADSYF